MKNRINQLLISFLCVVLVLSSSVAVFAAEDDAKLVEGSSESVVEQVTMDAAPFILDERTFIPIRYAATALGIDVAWDGETNKVTLTDSTKLIQVSMQVGSKVLEKTINGKTETVVMDVVPVNVNGRVYIPIRWALEPFEANVGWNSTTKTVNVSLDDKSLEFTTGTYVLVVKKIETAVNQKAEELKAAFTLITSQVVDPAMLEKWKENNYQISPEELSQYVMQWLQENKDKFSAEYILQVATKAYTYVKGSVPTVDEVINWATQTGLPALTQLKDKLQNVDQVVTDVKTEAQKIKDALKNL